MSSDSLRNWARRLKVETYALYLAYRDPRVSWPARIFLALVVGYAFSPIDLIPDFIPVLGYLDDLIIVPAGIWLALKLVPPEVMAECRAKAREYFGHGKPRNYIAAVVIVIIWLAALVLTFLLIFK